jgi:hypothetical protein
MRPQKQKRKTSEINITPADLGWRLPASPTHRGRPRDAVLGGNRGGGGEQNEDQAAMNINSEVKRTHDQSQSAGARRLRRFAARMVLGVRESQAWWTLKRPEGRSPFAPHDSTSAFGMNTSPEERLFALLALSTSRERGLIASRSDAPTVAVGFIPRLAAPDAPRRGATPESGAVFSIVTPRRRISWRIEPWLESHGYHHQVALRLRNRPG